MKFTGPRFIGPTSSAKDSTFASYNFAGESGPDPFASDIAMPDDQSSKKYTATISPGFPARLSNHPDKGAMIITRLSMAAKGAHPTDRWRLDDPRSDEGPNTAKPVRYNA